MRISDWSSDVCSSDLADIHGRSHPYRVSSMTLFVYGSCELLSMRLRVTCIDCAEILPIEHCHGPGSPPSDSRAALPPAAVVRSEEHTSELQSLMRNSYAVFCLTKKN